jgi:hypothetical protein
MDLNSLSRETLEESYLKLQQEHRRTVNSRYEVNIFIFCALILGILFYWPPNHDYLLTKNMWFLWSLLVLATIHIGLMCKTSFRFWRFWREDNAANFKIAKEGNFKNINSDAIKTMIKDAEKAEDFERANKLQTILNSRK